MSVPPPLPYFNPASHPAGRSAAITVTCVLGIILSVVVLLAISLVPVASHGNSYYPDRYMSGEAIGLAIGWLLQVSLNVLMLVACCGVLALRSAARGLLVVCAYGWIVAGVLGIVGLLYSFTTIKHAPIAFVAVSLTVIVAVNVAYPLFAITAVRRRSAATLFTATRWPDPLPALFKGAIILVLVWSGLRVLQGITRLGIVLRIDHPGAYRDYEMYRYGNWPLLPGIWEGTPALNAIIHLTLNLLLVIGALLALLRLASGRSMIVISTLVGLILIVAGWHGDSEPLQWLNGSGGSFSWTWVFSALSARANSVMEPALMLLIFTARPGGGRDVQEPLAADVLA